jgi:hypothetical protein
MLIFAIAAFRKEIQNLTGKWYTVEIAGGIIGAALPLEKRACGLEALDVIIGTPSGDENVSYL